MKLISFFLKSTALSGSVLPSAWAYFHKQVTTFLSTFAQKNLAHAIPVNWESGSLGWAHTGDC